MLQFRKTEMRQKSKQTPLFFQIKKEGKKFGAVEFSVGLTNKKENFLTTKCGESKSSLK